MLKLRQPVVIIGLGKTGFACLQFLSEKNISCTVVDSRPQPPFLKKAKETYPQVEIITGSLQHPVVENAGSIILSPGVDIREEVLVSAREKGAEIIGDIEIFARCNHVPVIGVTGSNGKSTVTELTQKLLTSLGVSVAMAGNIGTPVLQLLSNSQFTKEQIQYSELDYIVLELSSFQLDTTTSLRPVAATVLNISPDHLDRYDSFKQYQHSKLSILHENTIAVVPQNNHWELPKVKKIVHFGMDEVSDFSIRKIKNNYFIFIHLNDSVGSKPWMALSEVALSGQHNWLNILASLALVEGAGFSLMGNNKIRLQQVLKEYAGLPHRCEKIITSGQVLWINDSKATNVASTVAALESFATQFSGKIILIVGGDAKNADLTPLVKNIERHVFTLITLGKDGPSIGRLIKNVRIIDVSTLEKAVEISAEIAPDNGLVLLSPACSSLDMFQNFEQRGQQFASAVRRVAA